MRLPLLLSAVTGVLVLLLMLAGCAQPRTNPTPATTPATTLQHGPFEIIATGRRIASGGDPFSTMEVTSFSVRWRGQAVDVPQVGTRFWRALRLPGAHEPALLVSTTDFHLITEHEGRLVVKSLGPKSTDTAKLQWLDSQGGQPGDPRIFGVEPVDPSTGTEWRGGRWLRVSHHTVLDVQTLKAFDLRPWVPAGRPLSGMTSGSGAARMFSPGRTQFVVPTAQYGGANGSERIDALVVVDISGGETYAIRPDRRHVRFADHTDMDLHFIDHYFQWARDSAGGERLQPRPGVKLLPWRGRFVDFGDAVEYRVKSVRPEMDAALKRFVVDHLGARVVADWADPTTTSGNTFIVPGCDHVVAISFRDNQAGVHVPMPKVPPWRRCQGSVRSIGAAFDAELASGRLDRLFVGAE